MPYTLLITATVLAVIFSFGLGVFSLWRNPKATVVRLWFLMSMAITVWGIGYLLTLFTSDAAIALLSLRIVYFGAILVPMFFFHFVAHFTFRYPKVVVLTVAGYLLAGTFIVLAVGTSLIIKGVRYLETFGYYEDIATPGFYFLMAYFWFYVVYALAMLIASYRRSDGIRRRQMLWLLFASTIAFVGAGTNFLMDLTGGYPYGQLIVWLYPILVTYGIFVQEVKIKIRF